MDIVMSVQEKTVVALVNARNLVEFGWIQGDLACDYHGIATRADDERAVQFCSGGAVLRSTWDTLTDDELWDAGELAALYLATAILTPTGLSETEENVWGIIGKWNDAQGRTKTEVVQMFDKAIRLAEETP